MQHFRQTMLMTLGLCLVASAAAVADAPATGFDGSYRGSMTLAPGGLNDAYTAPACEDHRPAEALIRDGYVFLTYHDWHRHLIHYNGRVNEGGVVTAYHRNRDGSASRLTGNVSGSQFTADAWRGRCDYSFSLTKG